MLSTRVIDKKQNNSSVENAVHELMIDSSHVSTTSAQDLVFNISTLKSTVNQQHANTSTPSPHTPIVNFSTQTKKKKQFLHNVINHQKIVDWHQPTPKETEMIGTWEILLILLAVLLLFGGKKLPELAKGLGQGIREFKKASKEITDEIEEQK